MDLEKLKEYIQQELDSLKTNKKELGKAKTQLTLLKKELDDLYINSNLESFSELFKQFNFNMSFDKFKESIALIDFYKQIDTTNIPQYETINNELRKLKEQVNELIIDIDKQFQFNGADQEKIEILNEGLNILKHHNSNYIFSDIEISKLFNIIKILSIDISEKYHLIYKLANINVERKLLRDAKFVLNNSEVATKIEKNITVVNNLLTKSTELVNEPQDTVTEQISKTGVIGEEFNDNDLLLQIHEIINHLSEFFEIKQFGEITSETIILQRKEIYSLNDEISKYNWPLIYTDLCENLIPMYENGNKKEQIIEIFKFIIEKYNNYESVCDDFDSKTIEIIDNYLQDFDKINIEEIELLFKQMSDFNKFGYEYDNLSEIVGTKNKYTNEEIIIHQKIIDLHFYYSEYKKYRAREIKDRFSPDLAEDIANIKDTKEEIVKALYVLEQLKKQEDVIESDDIIDDEENNITFIEDNNTPSLVIFVGNTNNSDNILTIFDSFKTNGQLSTLRNIVNCIYHNHYSANQYNIDRYSEKSPYRKLADYDVYKSLEKNEMWRSDKGKIRCTYRAVHLTEKNKKILQSFFPYFEDTLFIMTGIYYKTGKDKGREYVKLTNGFVERNQDIIDYYIKLFGEDFESKEQIEEAIELIKKAYENYNYMCTSIKEKEEKKVGDK